MIFTEIEIAWILICLAIGSIVAATIGFGDALIIIPLLSLIMNPRSAVIFIGYWGLFMNIVNLYKYRKFTEKKYIIPVISGGAFGSILGALLIVVIMLRYLEIGLGIVILTFVALKLFKQPSVNKHQLLDPNPINNNESNSNTKNGTEKIKLDEGCGDLGACITSSSNELPMNPKISESRLNKISAQSKLKKSRLNEGAGQLSPIMSNQHGIHIELSANETQSNKILPPKILVPGGFLYAFLGSLLGASGPINVMMLQSSGFKKERFIANFAGCGLFLTIIKISMYTALGLFPIDNIWLLIAGYPVVYFSAKIGHEISRRWTPQNFEIIVYLVLVVMAFNFIF